MDNIKPERVTPTLTIFQKKGVFSYGTDAVLLVKFVSRYFKSLNKKKMCDLCSGTGIIPLMLCDASPSLLSYGVEINNDACSLAQMSAKESGLDERYIQINDDLKNVKSHLISESFDFVTCNPPYMTAKSGYMCADDYKTIARHEILCNINDIFKSAFYLLKTGGNLFIVYRSDRLHSLFSAANNNRFQIKDLVSFVSAPLPEVSKLVVCRAVKDGSEGLRHTIFKTQEFLNSQE